MSTTSVLALPHKEKSSEGKKRTIHRLFAMAMLTGGAGGRNVTDLLRLSGPSGEPGTICCQHSHQDTLIQMLLNILLLYTITIKMLIFCRTGRQGRCDLSKIETIKMTVLRKQNSLRGVDTG